MRKRWAPMMGAVGILLSASTAAADDGGPIAGFNDGFFLRDSHDWFRLYPRARLNLDVQSSFGPGVLDLSGADGGTALGPRVVVRRLRLELAGDLIQERINFWGSVDFGGQTITNANGKVQNAASKAGQTPTATTAKFAAVQSTTPVAAAQDVWINLHGFDWLNMMIGQYNAPFSMENRTSEGLTPWMERNVAIRGFVVPGLKETGITLWGSLPKEAFAYEVGVFGGDGQNRPQVDNDVDWIGRLFVRPFAPGGGILEKVQLGVSARHGDRDASKVGYDYPTITTGQGFTLWDPTYTDSQGRLTHVIPSGQQNQIGGELRIPIEYADLRGEAYWVDNHTREAVDGFQLTNTERLGRLHGVGWYVQLSCWPLGDPWVGGDPGMTRPRHLNLKEPFHIKKGLEVLAIVAGIDARYDGASRGGVADAKTPSGDVTVYEYGVGASYWFTRLFRAQLNYIVYHTPGSGTAANQAVVPGNEGKTPTAGANVLHELGARLAVQL